MKGKIAMKIGTATILTVSLGLGACASTGPRDHAAAAACNADATATLVGQAAPDDAAILRVTGGMIVRRIAPGDPTTRDYRIERVTITVGDGRVVAASCG